MSKWGVVVLITVLLSASGCAAAQEDEVEQVTERLHAAIDQQDGAAACELLSQQTQMQLQSSGDSCEVAVLEAGLSPDGRVEQVNVFDTSAQVRYDDDVIFLSDFPEGWRVIGAGCTPQAERPYDCAVQGG